MAGGKETPRQKMIGMMYLVLTALLALQVSSAVLEKFAIINETMIQFKEETNRKNALTLNEIVKEAGKSQNARVVNARENAQKVRDLTATTLAGVEKVKLEMMKHSNTDKITEGLINDHSSKVAAMMIQTPVGKNFEKLLVDYVASLEKFSGLKFEPLAKKPKDMPLFASDEDHVNKDFLTFTFENTPSIAAITSVTQIETEILEYESKALDKLLSDAGIGKVSFDNMVPMVRTKSSVVAAGAKYEADLFISASSSSFNPEMYRDGQKLELFNDPSGVRMGKIEFTATAGSYDPKTLLATKKFLAEIKLPDTTLRQEVEYYVAQPVIKVTTGNAPTLYMNCGNPVNIEVPTLGTSYNPSFSASGATIIKGDKPGRVTIIPTQRKINVNVSNAGTGLGSVGFDVKPIPLPRYIIRDNSGKEVDKKVGVRGSSLTGLRVVPEPDETFKEMVPKDAVYRIRSMEVIHARGSSPVNRMNATNEVLDLGPWRSQFKPGDRIVIEIKTVTRRTYQGQDERVEVRNEVHTVPIQ
ncbi:MAG TPA: gliding motility protein GldM [Chryseosolibacter sp.]|nr:gliding motility protein GldM [Chryseosolibacter sp.]